VVATTTAEAKAEGGTEGKAEGGTEGKMKVVVLLVNEKRVCTGFETAPL
jgi:hypothetical protein